ncbi:hypothetical protein LCGC14_1955730 [marine sediment metagenome]|uniref:Uncharacterized protein n=1 Tax=marine sediment metagenome TaxID=412755 RepID=A0A0F9HUH4_9ZZZZ
MVLKEKVLNIYQILYFLNIHKLIANKLIANKKELFIPIPLLVHKI